MDFLKQCLNKIISYFGLAAALFVLLLILLSLLQVGIRNIEPFLRSEETESFLSALNVLCNTSYNVLEELKWHCFSAVFLLGMAVTWKEDAHVRIDIIYDRFPSKIRRIINLFSILGIVIPLSCIMIYYGISFSYDAFVINEASSDPGGLPYRWIVKALIPIGFVLLVAQGLLLAYDEFCNLFIKDTLTKENSQVSSEGKS